MRAGQYMPGLHRRPGGTSSPRNSGRSNALHDNKKRRVRIILKRRFFFLLFGSLGHLAREQDHVPEEESSEQSQR